MIVVGSENQRLPRTIASFFRCDSDRTRCTRRKSWQLDQRWRTGIQNSRDRSSAARHDEPFGPGINEKPSSQLFVRAATPVSVVSMGKIFFKGERRRCGELPGAAAQVSRRLVLPDVRVPLACLFPSNQWSR